LKINELNGHFYFSKTISLNNEAVKKVKIRLDTEGVLFLENEGRETANIFVFNTLGQLLFSKNNLLGVEKISLSDLPMGVYIVEIQTGKKWESVKILKRG
jgi:Secretion system C-terminal sorting domain